MYSALTLDFSISRNLFILYVIHGTRVCFLLKKIDGQIKFEDFYFFQIEA